MPVAKVVAARHLWNRLQVRSEGTPQSSPRQSGRAKRRSHALACNPDKSWRPEGAR